jgi:thiamine pyrophosphate-dependent acetolactate synthase large subunit-like protein
VWNEEYEMKGKELVAEVLKKEGVKQIFGFPLSEIFESAAAVGIRPIIARTERVAINMADGFSRMRAGRDFGVITVQFGPGTENSFGAIAQAYGDNTPILFLPTGNPLGVSSISPNFQASRNFRHITKWCETADSIDRLPQMLQYAFTQLRTGAPGPVLLELPVDVLEAESSWKLDAYQSPRRAAPPADPAYIIDAANALLHAKTPVIMAGQGVLYAQASDELRELAEWTQVPVTTTPNGKSAFPENHPLALGAAGRTRLGTVDHFLNKADLVFGVGTSFTRSFYITPIPGRAKLIQITINPADVSKDYAVSLGLVGDAKAICRQILEHLKSLGGRRNNHGKTIEQVQAVRSAFMEKWTPVLTSSEEPISPYRVVWEILQAVDREKTVITHDAGNPRDQMVPFYETIVAHGYLGWGKSTQLGTGLGLAMGAKLAKPEWLVINVMGEAAFGMVGMDFETATRCGAPVLTIVLKNGVMGGYSKYLPTATERYQITQLSGEYADVAKALGGYSEKITHAADLRSALKRCIGKTQSGQPALLEIGTSEEKRMALP